MTWIICRRKAKPKAKVRPPLPTADEAAKMIDARMKRMQLRIPKRPMKDGKPLRPRLPADLTALNDVQIGKLYTEFCTMAQWCTLLLAVKAVEKAVAETSEKFARAEIRMGQEGTVADKNAMEELDTSVRARTLKTLAGKGTELLTNAFFQSYIIGRDAISRELTRRMGLAQERRT